MGIAAPSSNTGAELSFLDEMNPPPPRDDNGVAADAGSKVDRAAGSSGQSLDPSIRAKFESSLSADLSNVRIHTGPESAAAARAVGARAYTVGNDIHFAENQCAPGTGAGEHLLAHEVAHTVQQSGGNGSIQYKLEVSSPVDAAEREADTAADAMVRGVPASLVGSSFSQVALHRDAVEFEEDKISTNDDANSSQMRENAEAQVQSFRRRPPSRSEGASCSADAGHAASIVSQIEGSTGDLGAMQGREAALNAEGKKGGYKSVQKFVPYSEASSCLGQNKTAKGQLLEFQTAANKQDFQHTFFAQAYRKLQEDFLRLESTVSVIVQKNLKVVGDDAAKDVQDAKRADPLMGDAIGALKAAITDMKTVSSSATAGVAAAAATAAGTFSQLETETEALKLPPPQLQDDKEQTQAKAVVAKVNADLAAAKATIATVKAVVKAAMVVATGGAGAVGMPILEGEVANMGKKATEMIGKVGLTDAAGMAKKAAGPHTGAAQSSLESSLASWITNYNTRVSAASGKVNALNAKNTEKVQAIQAGRVQNLQAQLAGEIGKFALLQKQIEEKKAAVTEAAKKVQELAKKQGKRGTDIGAAAQAMASVSNFLTQADSAEALGKQEQESGNKAQDSLKDVAGDYHMQRQKGQLGGADTLAETQGGGGNSFWWECKRAGDADTRGKHDFSGYKIIRRNIIFVVNEDDVDQRSRPMKDRTDSQLGKIAKWKGEASQFESKLASTLGTGPSSIK